MNLLLLDESYHQKSVMVIQEARQVQHLHYVLKVQEGDVIRLGIRQRERFLGKILALDSSSVTIQRMTDSSFDPNPPNKKPVTLVLALPRPKVLRRIIQDATAMGVQKIVILHSYHVDKSYWSSPILQTLDQAVTLGLEQAQDTIIPSLMFEKRFKPFVEDKLSTWITPKQPAYVLHPHATTALPTNIMHSCILIVGCERGFIPYEIDLLRKNGCEICQIGSRILRTENSIPYSLGRLFN